VVLAGFHSLPLELELGKKLEGERPRTSREGRRGYLGLSEPLGAESFIGLLTGLCQPSMVGLLMPGPDWTACCNAKGICDD
jgi:hypothetical protein